MRFLFDILHPAHVHVLRNPMALLEAQGHDVIVTARKKDVATDLLTGLGIDHTVLSEQRSGSVGLATELLSRTYRLVRLARKQRADVLIGLMGPSIAPAGKLLGLPTFVLYDTEIATRTNRWVYPMATEVITPECYTTPVNGNHVTYRGYHELAYLHPNQFTPQRSALDAFGIDPSEPYLVVRLPGFASSHDGAEVATDLRQWMTWIERLSKDRTVYVSSERPLPSDLDVHRLVGPTIDIHHVLAFADIVIGESATMATEAAVLGTPAVFIGATTRGYIDDIEKRYGLIKRVLPTEFNAAIQAADELMAPGQSNEHQKQHAALIDDHIDVSPWLVDHILSAVSPDSSQ